MKGDIGMVWSTKKEETRGHYTEKLHKATWHHPYIIVYCKVEYRTKIYIGMVSCSFVQLFCVMTTCFFLFGASNHPYIPFHFEEMIFPLVLLTIEHDMFSKPCQQWRLQPQPWATDVQPQHDLGKRLTVEQCVLPASGGDTETSGAAVNELSQKWDYTFTSREPHILSPGVDIDRSGEESLDCLHISSLSSIVELCSSLGIEKRIIRTVTSKIVLGINLLQKVVHYDSHCRLQYSSVGPDCDRAGQLLVCPYSCVWGSP